MMSLHKLRAKTPGEKNSKGSYCSVSFLGVRRMKEILVPYYTGKLYRIPGTVVLKEKLLSTLISQSSKLK